MAVSPRMRRRAHTVSCEKDWNLDFFVEQVWENLGLLKVYTKRRGGALDTPHSSRCRGGGGGGSRSVSARPSALTWHGTAAPDFTDALIMRRNSSVAHVVRRGPSGSEPLVAQADPLTTASWPYTPAMIACTRSATGFTDHSRTSSSMRSSGYVPVPWRRDAVRDWEADAGRSGRGARATWHGRARAPNTIRRL